MARILAFSYAFPPMQVQMGPVVAKAMTGLTEAGVAVDVLCADSFSPFLGEDASLLPYVAQHFNQVVRLSPDQSLIRSRWARDARFAALPDLMGVLGRSAYRYLLGHDLSRYDAVITWSPFHSVNPVMAALKKQRPRVKWIAQFSDPWARNPLEQSRLRRWWNHIHEGSCVKSADFVVHSSEYSRAQMFSGSRRMYNEKSTVIPHPFAPGLYPLRRPARSDRIVLRYVGVLFGRRSPEPLFQALLLLFARNPSWRDRLALELVGATPPQMLTTPAAMALKPDVLVHRPGVGYVESLAQMHSADILVLIEADTRQNLFVPSKLSDYIGAGRPILGLAPPGGSADLLRMIGAPIAPPGAPLEIAAALERLLDAPREEWPQGWGDPAVREGFSTQAIGRRFCSVLERVV